MTKLSQVGFLVAIKSSTNNKGKNSHNIKAKTMIKNKGAFKSAVAVFERYIKAKRRKLL